MTNPSEVRFPCIRHGNCRVWFKPECRNLISTQEAAELLTGAALSRCHRQEAGTLGRGGFMVLETTAGSLAVRRYLRGGWLRSINDSAFLSDFGDFRPLAELKILDRLFSSGVNVPEPVAAVIHQRHWGLTYCGLMITRYLSGAQNLLTFAAARREAAEEQLKIRSLCRAAGIEAGKMLAQKVFHSDLHLGNVLICDSAVYLIDFDKAKLFDPENTRRLAEKLVARWNRSARKHLLETGASEPFAEGLREGLSGTWRGNG